MLIAVFMVLSAISLVVGWIATFYWMICYMWYGEYSHAVGLFLVSSIISCIGLILVRFLPALGTWFLIALAPAVLLGAPKDFARHNYDPAIVQWVDDTFVKTGRYPARTFGIGMDTTASDTDHQQSSDLVDNIHDVYISDFRIEFRRTHRADLTSSGLEDADINKVAEKEWTKFRDSFSSRNPSENQHVWAIEAARTNTELNGSAPLLSQAEIAAKLK